MKGRWHCKSGKSEFEKFFFCFISVFIITIVLIINFYLSCVLVLASVMPGTPFLNLSQDVYGPGQIIEGKLNFSLINETDETKIIARVQGSMASYTKGMNLLEFLSLSNANFNCTNNCTITYSSTNPAESKTINLYNGSEVYYGLVVSGNNVTIENLSFVMIGSSNATPVCGETPLKVDILSDNSVDFEYKEVSGFCQLHSSECFNETYSEVGILDETPVCQKIKLEKTGKVQVKALISRSGEVEDNDKIYFSIYNLDGQILGDCYLDGWEVGEVFGLYGCVIGELQDETEEQINFYISNATDYFVCVRKSYGAAGEYSIKKETMEKVCGFYGAPSASSIFTEDYAIYVQEGRFAPFNGETEFNASSAIGDLSLINYLNSYLSSKYSNNCTSSCIIPIKFTSLANQQIIFKNLNLKYRPGQQQSPTTSSKFYDLSVVRPKITMNYTSLSLVPLNLTAPENYSTYTLSVTVSQASGQKPFRVEQIAQILHLYPTTIVPSQETLFRVSVIVPSGRKIMNYTWDFGDNSEKVTTTEPEVTHTYPLGTFTMTVKVTDNKSISSIKTFTISSNFTKEMVNSTLVSLKNKLNTFVSQYNSLEPWYSDKILSREQISLWNNTLNNYTLQINSATSQQLVQMKQELESLKIPNEIITSMVFDESYYYPSLENINPEYIARLSNESYNSNLENQYKNRIVNWHEENLEIKMEGETKALVADTTEDKVTLITINLIPKKNVQNLYFVMLLPNNVNIGDVLVKEGLTKKDLTDALGFEFSQLSSTKTISLAIPGKQDLSNLIFYASPSLSELNTENIIEAVKEKKPYAFAIIFGIFIIFIVVVLLIIVWKDYDKKIEKKLFKNPSDLYNLMNFIIDAKQKQISKEKIEEQLIKAKWSQQQINYAWKKVLKQEKRQGKENQKLAKYGGYPY